MARIRSIHPGIYTDEQFMSASMAARVLLPGLWIEAWDDGVIEWRPLRLKARIFPADNVNVPELLEELVELGFMQKFTAGEKQYAAIKNFRKWQKPKAPNSSNALPHELFDYVGIGKDDEETSDDSPKGSEQLPKDSGNGSEKSRQKGGREEGRKGEEAGSLRSPDAGASPAAVAEGKPKPKADPNDPKTILWREGKVIVDRLEIKSSKGPGGLLGMFVDDAKSADGSVDYALVLDVVREAEKQRPDHPLPWIRAAIRARVSPGGLFGSVPAVDPDDPGGVNAWCAANGVAPATSPGDMKVAKWIVAGVRFDQTARDILLAAGMAFDVRYDWGPLRQWAEAGVDSEAIYQTIKRMVVGMRARGDYTPPGSLKFFDNAVRATAGRTAA